MKANLIKVLSVVFIAFALVFKVMATPVDTYEFKSEANQERAITLATELRCPQCQNQNLVDSNSPVARDLRIEVYKMVDAGKDDQQIIDFMTSRYGEFVLYKPRLESKTLILWGGPIILLLFGLLVGFIFVRKQRIAKTNEPELSAEEQKQLNAILKQGQK